MTTFELGQWNAICDRCGLKLKARQIRKEWNGLRVCHDCWEPRHPQELLRGKTDRQAPPWARPDSEGTDVSPGSGNEVEAGDL